MEEGLAEDRVAGAVEAEDLAGSAEGAAVEEARRETGKPQVAGTALSARNEAKCFLRMQN